MELNHKCSSIKTFMLKKPQEPVIPELVQLKINVDGMRPSVYRASGGDLLVYLCVAGGQVPSGDRLTKN